MTLSAHPEQVFLSYSRTDREACIALRSVLEQAGLSIFRDEDAIRIGDRWVTRLQEAAGVFRLHRADRRDGVQRWVGAEVEVALTRHLSPHDDVFGNRRALTGVFGLPRLPAAELKAAVLEQLRGFLRATAV